MNAKSLYDAITELKKENLVSGRDELLKTAIASSTQDITINSEIFKIVMNFLDGGRRMSEIIDELNSFSANTDTSSIDLSKIIAVYTDVAKESSFIAGTISDITGDSSQGDNPNTPIKSDANASIIQIFPADITPASRFADASALFLTTIPTIELSRCVPFLDIRLILPRKLSDGRKPLSLFNFLQGTAPTNSTQTSIANANMVTVEGLARDANTGTNELATFQHTLTGMEMFTSPQTLTNVDDAYTSSNRSVPIIDPFRPLLSLKSLEFNIIPTTGMMSYKSGKMQFTCHDRSRLSEIADLVRPDLYSTVELLIEYGWSHPDGSSSSENSYGKLINNMHAREKYGVMNSSFTFTEAGQVDISLDIYMKGVVDFSTVKIAQSKKVIETAQYIQHLSEMISEARSKIQNVKGTKEVRGTTILSSASDIDSALTLGDDAIADLKKYLTSTASDADPSTKQIHETLVDLFGSDGKGGKKKALESELTTIISDKLTSLSTTDDPLLQKLSADTLKYSEKTSFDRNSYVSLGKLFLRFVAEPLLSSHKFDEVHLIFYTFNSGAGAVRNVNIGSFPIKTGDFLDSFGKYTEKKNKFNITLREFIDYFSVNFIADPSNEAYGMSNVYKSVGFNEAGDRKPVESNLSQGKKGKSGKSSGASNIPELKAKYDSATAKLDSLRFSLNKTTDPSYLTAKKDVQTAKAALDRATPKVTDKPATPTAPTTEDDTSAINSTIEQTMQKIGISDGVFRMPEVDLIVEAVPQGLGTGNDNGDQEWTLLRIHIVDKVASPYLGLQQLLDSMLDGNLGSFGDAGSTTDDQSSHQALAAKILDAALREQLIERVVGGADSKKTYKLGTNSNPKGIKNFVSKLVPTLRYGTSTSAIKQLSMRSLQEPLLNTIHMQRAGVGDPSEAPGTDGEIVPLQMLPTELDMDTFGCPLVTFGQQFFIDLDTGTTIDNIYGVTGLTHSIGPGKFDSSFKMINIDAYGKYRSIINSIASAINVLGANGEGALNVTQKK